MKYLGDYIEDAILYFSWSTYDKNGASINRATDGTIKVYKDDDTTESTAGITDTEDFDGITGVHNCKIDLSAAAFYATGSDYSIVLVGAVIDSETVNAVLATFSIENRFAEVDLVKWLGSAPAALAAGGLVQGDTIKVVNATPISTADINAECDTALTDFLSITGFTSGGTWTFQKLMKVWAAFFTGKKQLKSGETDVYEFLDPDDDSTKVFEMTVSNSTPYFTFNVLI